MLNAIVTTHDGYGLAASLKSMVRGSHLPDRLVITCDGVVGEVDRVVEEFSRGFGRPVVYVRRAYKGIARRSQTRNNGVRALGPLRAEDTLFFLDGHILLGAGHFRLLGGLQDYDVVLSGFCRGDPAVSERVAREGQVGLGARARRSPELWLRSVKLAVQQALRGVDRRWGTRWAKVWWPSLCSANFAVKYGAYARVNGFDEGELFDDWSPEDDDLGRRLYAAGASICNATLRLGGFHLWHPSNRVERGRVLRADLAKYFNGPMEARYGLRTPRDQEPGEVKVDVFGG